MRKTFATYSSFRHRVWLSLLLCVFVGDVSTTETVRSTPSYTSSFGKLGTAPDLRGRQGEETGSRLICARFRFSPPQIDEPVEGRWDGPKNSQPPPNLPRSSGEEQVLFLPQSLTGSQKVWDTDFYPLLTSPDLRGRKKKRASLQRYLPQRLGEIQRGLKTSLLLPSRILTAPSRFGRHRARLKVSSVPDPGQDWDSAVVEVISSVNPEGGDWDANTLESKGLKSGEVEGFPPAEVNVQGSSVVVNANQQTGIRLYSSTIPLDAGPATVNLKVKVEGERPEQLGVALINSEDNHAQFSSMLYNLLADDEISTGERQVSVTYTLPTPGAVLLFQIIGPDQGRSTVTVRTIRVYPGTWPVDRALGPTRVSLVEDFEQDDVLAEGLEIVSTETRRIIPGGLGRCGLLETQAGAEVVQSYLSTSDPFAIAKPPTNIEARVWVRRPRGSEGSFALGLLNVHQNEEPSVPQTAVTVIPVRDLPKDHWRMIRTGGMFTTEDTPLVVLQLTGGPAEILVDDIELHAPHDSIWFWDASYDPTPTPTPVKARITPSPTPTAAPTPPPTATPTATPTTSPTPIVVISAPEAAAPGVTNASVELVGIDGPVLPRPAVVTLSVPSLDPVPGTAFISSSPRAGIERSDDNPARINLAIPFELPAGYRDAHLQFWASVEGKNAEIRLNSNPMSVVLMNRGSFTAPQTFSGPFKAGRNELNIKLEADKPKPIAISFRMVVTFRD